MAALVRHDAFDKAVIGITELEAAKQRFPAPGYVHHVPGRLRLKAAEFRDNRRLLETACGELAALAGVRTVSPNRLTGSIVIEYDPLVSAPAALLEAIQQCGFPRMPLVEAAGLAGAEQASLTERLAGVAARRLFDWFVDRLVVSAIAAVI